MTVIWLVVIAAVIAVLTTRVVRPARGESHLGFVSERWLAEHRVSDMADPRR